MKWAPVVSAVFAATGLTGCNYGHGTFPPVPAWAVPEVDWELKKDVHLRRLQELAATMPVPKESFPALVEECEYGAWEVKRAALNLLKELAPLGPEDVPLFLDALGRVRRGRGECPLTPEDVVLATKYLKEGREDWAGRVELAERLWRVGPAAVPTLVKALKDPKQRTDALSAIALLGSMAKDAVPALMDEITCTDWHFREDGAVAWVLARIGADAGLPLIHATRSERWWVRQEAQRALVEMAKFNSEGVVAMFSDLLHNLDVEVRLSAIQILAELPMQRRDILLLVTAALNDERTEVREAAQRTLERIEGQR